MAKNYNPGVAKAIEQAGGTYQALAEELGVTQQAVRKMLYVNCSAERALEIEEITGVPREEIRPDLFIKNFKPENKSIPIPTSKQYLKECEHVPDNNTHHEPVGLDAIPEQSEIAHTGADTALGTVDSEVRVDTADSVRRIEYHPDRTRTERSVDLARSGRRTSYTTNRPHR